MPPKLSTAPANAHHIEERMENWTVAFVVRELPPELLISGEHYLFVPAEPALVAELVKLGEKIDSIKLYFRGRKHTEFFLGAFRVNASGSHDAFERGLSQVESIIDAYAPCAEIRVPELGPFYFAAKDGDNHLALSLASPGSWVVFHSKDGHAEKRWRERNAAVVRRFVPFFDVASGEHKNADSELARQLVLSMRLYRYGCEVGTYDAAYGVEFLCKWAALEGLIRGKSGPPQIADTLKDRVPLVFPASERSKIKGIVKKLWKFRNDAAHGAKVFYFPHMDESHPLAIEMDEVDRLFVAVAGFAINHLNDVMKVEELWVNARNYTPVPELYEARPKELVKFAARNMTQGTLLVIPALRAHIEKWRVRINEIKANQSDSSQLDAKPPV